MPHRLALWLVLCVLLAACGADAAPAGSPAAFEEGSCDILPQGGYELRCGSLSVAEDRSRADSPRLHLEVEIIKSKSANPAPDPVVYLEGGPGGSPFSWLDDKLQAYFGSLLETRDIILFDQRGAGQSEPALDCPEVSTLTEETLDTPLSQQEWRSLWRAAMQHCHDRLAGEGVNFEAYDSAASAADLAELRSALGYEQWNLLGVSYGTRLALTAMRDYPQGLRSVILDSSLPPQVDLYADTPASMNRAFEVLFDGCARDSACNQAYPDLRTAFYELVDHLNTQPVLLRVNREQTFRLTGDRVIATLGAALYSRESFELMPNIIYAGYRHQDYGQLASYAHWYSTQGYLSQGMNSSVNCNEEAPFTTRERVAEANARYPQLRGVFDDQYSLDVCATWGVTPNATIENEPVQSAIPSLILAGEYDPITPPSYGELAAQTLSNSTLLTVPDIGHGAVFAHDCPRGIARAFLDNPAAKPDAGCIAEMRGPAFALPIQSVTMVPFEHKPIGRELHITGLMPEGWIDLFPEDLKYTSYYGPSGGGESVLWQRSSPGAGDGAVRGMGDVFGALDQPVAAGKRVGKNLTWELFTMERPTGPADLAIARYRGNFSMIVLLSSKSEHQLLYEQAFLPALDAFAVVE